VRIEKDYTFDGPDGKASLLDVFEGRSQLLLYHFMFGPNQDAGCDGCSMVVDQICHLAHLHARDTSFAAVSRAPLEKIEAYRKRMGWTIPWYSSFESDFNVDFGVGPETPQPDVYQDGETFGLSAFLREGDRLLRTYFTTQGGVEVLGTVWTLLDVTPLGRQENWEDSPAGVPRTAAMGLAESTRRARHPRHSPERQRGVRPARAMVMISSLEALNGSFCQPATRSSMAKPASRRKQSSE
jgi:predicted dithiol-disulfide oxidoreductase (DUF899 family)